MLKDPNTKDLEKGVTTLKDPGTKDSEKSAKTFKDPITKDSEKGAKTFKDPGTKDSHSNVTTPSHPPVKFCGVEKDNGEFDHNSTGRFKRYIRQGSIWRKTNLKWTLRTPSSRTNLPSGVIRQQLIAAMNLWQQESMIVFEEVDPQSSDVDIYVDFHLGDHGDGNKFDGPGGTLAHAFYPGYGIGGDVHFDDAENFATHKKVVEYVSTSLLITAAHEFGHSLGLSHSDVDKALMSPIYQTFPVDFNKLPDDDIRGIQALYGKPEEPEIPEIYTFLPSPTPFIPTDPPKPVTPPTRPSKPVTRPPRPPKPTVPTTTKAPYPTKRPPKPTSPPVVPTESCRVGHPRKGAPDMCSTDFDSVTVFREEIFFFKGMLFWRISRKGRLYERGAPHGVHRYFIGLPKDVNRIDAAFENKRNNIVLISGTRYYELDGNLRLVKSDQLLSLGVNATRLNAAMMWGYNGRVYLFSGDSYWRLDYEDRAELDYPRDTGVWRDLPVNYTGALTFRAKTYFFSGKMFWTFNATGMRLEDPLLIGPYWFGCPNRRLESRIPCRFSSAHSLHCFTDLQPYRFLLLVIHLIIREYFKFT
ncbi:stromelysin-3-like [Palaemon carinicauda]|uniref:stromelysin-3-like n=1 Tax=Palaemon carinicauda TaxID=392227 RepID=UPI0035B66F9C